MNEKIQIREMTPDDADRVAVIHTKAWQEAYRGIVPQDFLDAIDVNKRAENWRKGIESNEPKLIRLVSVIANTVTGFICGLENRDQVLIPNADSELWAIYVDPTCWNSGSGMILMQEFCRRLSDLGKHRMIVWVLKDNQIGKRFYEKCGGKLLGTEKIIHLGGQDLVEVPFEFQF